MERLYLNEAEKYHLLLSTGPLDKLENPSAEDSEAWISSENKINFEVNQVYLPVQGDLLRY